MISLFAKNQLDTTISNWIGEARQQQASTLVVEFVANTCLGCRKIANMVRHLRDVFAPDCCFRTVDVSETGIYELTACEINNLPMFKVYDVGAQKLLLSFIGTNVHELKASCFVQPSSSFAHFQLAWGI
jgi:hypothetical protein